MDLYDRDEHKSYKQYKNERIESVFNIYCMTDLAELFSDGYDVSHEQDHQDPDENPYDKQ